MIFDSPPLDAPVDQGDIIDGCPLLHHESLISSPRGSEPAMTPLATDTFSPNIDNRPHLAPGPETRQYQAVYLQNDHPSAIFSITVPASTPTPSRDQLRRRRLGRNE